MASNASYRPLQFNNPLFYLFTSALCYIVSGVTMLCMGVIITSVTFQNLESYEQSRKERYAGPILMGVGLLVMGKGAFYNYRLRERPSTNSRRSWRDLFPWRRRSSDQCNQALTMSATELNLRTAGSTPSMDQTYPPPPLPELPLCRDDPPSYDMVTTNQVNAFINPLALELAETQPPTSSDDETQAPPPPYEEAVSRTQERLLVESQQNTSYHW